MSISSKDRANGYLTASYQTTASLNFIKHNSMHRKDGRLLNDKRRIERAENGRLIDNNKLLDPADTTHALNYYPLDPGFTLTEQLKFALAYQDTPANFGLISQYLPGRSVEECVHHYYTHKGDGRFKNESRRERYDRLDEAMNQKMLNPPLYRERPCRREYL